MRLPRLPRGGRKAPANWGFVFLSAAIIGVAASESGWLPRPDQHPPTPAGDSELTGSPRIIDGDTIAIGGARIRLWGIDAPEAQQTCEGKGGEVYECGRDATAVLRELAGGRQATCTARDRDRYGRVVAVCRTEAGELNAAMVRRGWAVDYTHYSDGHYRLEEREARREHLGIWSGRFEMPWEWRADRRASRGAR